MTDRTAPYVALVTILVILGVGGYLSYWSMRHSDDLPPFDIRRVVSPDVHLFKRLGLEPVEFEVNVPGPAKITVWIETYHKGVMQPESSFGYSLTRTDGFKGRIAFHRYSPLADEAADPARVAWSVALYGETITMPGGERWMNDPLAEADRSPLHGPDIADGHHLEWSTDTRLYTFQKNDNPGPVQTFHTDEPDIIANTDRAVFFKVRIDPLPVGAGPGSMSENFDPTKRSP